MQLLYVGLPVLVVGALDRDISDVECLQFPAVYMDGIAGKYINNKQFLWWFLAAVAEAAALLGGPHTIRSLVVHGHARGRTLGYPTANLSPQIEGFIPRDGVYAAWLNSDGVRFPAAVSIGNNPTFEGVPSHQVEAHAIDASLELYGKVVEIAFVEHIRGMRKFSGAGALAEQMGADEQGIRAILGVPA